MEYEKGQDDPIYRLKRQYQIHGKCRKLFKRPDIKKEGHDSTNPAQYNQPYPIHSGRMKVFFRKIMLVCRQEQAQTNKASCQLIKGDLFRLIMINYPFIQYGDNYGQ